MLTIHCTKKLLGRLPVNVGETLRSKHSAFYAANEAPPTLLSGWHATTLTLQRRQCVLLAHDDTRFPVFIPALRKADFTEFDHRFIDGFMNTLLKSGVEEEVMELAATQLAPIRNDETITRSVLGTVKSMAQHNGWTVHSGE